jgi:acyl CoA:acetate/3-ketoacid CoA transferase
MMVTKELIERCEMTGNFVPSLNFAACIIEIMVNEVESCTNRADDAVRIPGMLLDHAVALRQKAMEVSWWSNQQTTRPA